MAICELELDVTKPAEHVDMVQGRQGDTETIIRVAIYDDGIEYDFTGKYLEFNCIRRDGKWVRLADPENVMHIGNTHKWDIKLPVEATAYDGLVKVALCTVKSEDDPFFRDSTNGFLIHLEESATAEAHLGPYSDQVDKLLMYIQQLIKAWEEQMAQQQKDYEAAEADRYETFKQSEADRQADYEANEQARQERSDKACEIVEDAYHGQFDPSIEAWMDAHFDVDEHYGVFSYQAWLKAYEGLPNTEATEQDVDDTIGLIGGE